MKPVVVPLLLLSSFLFLSPIAAAAAAASEPVLDTDGQEVKRGAKYHILPIDENPGGLVLYYRPGVMCPPYVAKDRWRASPVVFDPSGDGGDAAVRLGTDAAIVFVEMTYCMRATNWVLAPRDVRTGRIYVMAGVPHPGTPDRQFSIERFEGNGGYKLAFCPKRAPGGDGSTGDRLCGDLGLFVEDGVAWLGFGGSPIPVAFKRARGEDMV